MSKTSLQQEFQSRIDYEELMNCTRCGFCLPSCPTYIKTGGNEASSPRGRIALMKAVADGKKEPDEEVEAQLNECLGCRACEPACPSGVNYGHILEQARAVIQEHKRYSVPVRVLRKTVFQWLFLDRRRMETVHRMRWMYEKTPVQKLMQKSGAFRLLPGEAALMERIMPEAAPPKQALRPPVLAVRQQQPLKKVAFFDGCLMSTMFTETNQNTLYLLEKSGCEVVVPDTQQCCGALHAHAGEADGAKKLAKTNIEAFEQTEADFIVTNAGGCGAGLKEYPFLLKEEPEWCERAKVFSEKVGDISTLLAELELPPMKLDAELVTYQPSCHLENVMKEKGNVEALLRRIEGVTYAAMPDKEQCCGSAGIYNLVQPRMAMKILDKKMADVRHVQASVIVTSNPGCLLQMKAGIEREGLADSVKAVHIVDLAAEALKQAESGVTT